MKNVIKHSKKGILMVTMLTTLLSFANEGTFYTIKNDAKRTSLTLKNVKEGNLLSIIDANGIVLYKEVIEKTGLYIKGFDLTALPDGNYIFELEKDMEISTIPFTVKETSVLFDKSSGKTSYKPFTDLKDNILYVSKLALNKEPMEIKIYYMSSESTDLMYSETVANIATIQKVFKLTGLKEGNYKVVFNTEGRTFTKTF